MKIVYMGSGEGNQDFLSFASMMAASLDVEGNLDLVKFTEAGLNTLNPELEMEQEPNMPVGHIASLFNAQGPNANCLTACAASNQAVGEAGDNSPRRSGCYVVWRNPQHDSSVWRYGI